MRWWIALGFVAGCRGSAPAPSASGKDAAAVAIAIDAGPPPIDARLAPDERCPDPCRLLDQFPLDELAAAVEAACGAPYVAVAGCDELDRLRNCVYAVHGYAFEKGKWREAFGGKPWYTKRADFKDSDLGAMGTANVAALRQRGTECRAGVMVSAEDRARVAGFFATIATGKPALPAIVLDNLTVVRPASLRRMLTAHRDTTYRLRANTPMKYAPPFAELKAALPGKRFRMITVDLSGCQGLSPEQCDDALWIDLAFDDATGALLALRHGMAS